MRGHRRLGLQLLQPLLKLISFGFILRWSLGTARSTTWGLCRARIRRTGRRRAAPPAPRAHPAPTLTGRLLSACKELVEREPSGFRTLGWRPLRLRSGRPPPPPPPPRPALLARPPPRA